MRRLSAEGGGVAAAGVAAAGVAAADYADALAGAMSDEVDAVAWKTVAAYRGGLALDWRRPGPAEVRAAAAEWLGSDRGGGRWRLEHPTLIRHGIWQAIDTGRPLQVHTGFGDTDATLGGSHPEHLTDLIAATADLGVPIMLLHTWPHHRVAGYLAAVWPHVHLDVGLALPHVGHRGASILAEALELAPWHKVLYSSDAFGLAELFHLGAAAHRRALGAALAPLADAGLECSELARLASLVAAGNARRVYARIGAGA